MLRNGIGQRFRFINVKIKILIMRVMSRERFDISFGVFFFIVCQFTEKVIYIFFDIEQYYEPNLERATYICITNAQ